MTRRTEGGERAAALYEDHAIADQSLTLFAYDCVIQVTLHHMTESKSFHVVQDIPRPWNQAGFLHRCSKLAIVQLRVVVRWMYFLVSLACRLKIALEMFRTTDMEIDDLRYVDV